jgi:hypothetical protein
VAAGADFQVEAAVVEVVASVASEVEASEEEAPEAAGKIQ